MLSFHGKTLIEWQIEMYRSLGIEDIIIVKGFAGEKINYKDVQYVSNPDYANTNMLVSLMCAKQLFDDSLIVSYSDILFEKKMLEDLINLNYDSVVVVDDNWQEYWKVRYGKVDFDTESLIIGKENQIISLGKEQPNIKDIDARYVGLMKFSKNTLNDITNIYERDKVIYQEKSWKNSGKPIHNAYMTDLLQALIDENLEVKALRYQNGWLEFDTNEDYEKASKWVEDGTLIKFINGIV
jgi:choline kinase